MTILFISTFSQVDAQSKYLDKYKDQLEPGSLVLDERYNSTLEQIDPNLFIRKYFFPETKQITHFISYNRMDQKMKNGTYREWLDDGTIYINGKYENDVRTGLWLLQGETGYFNAGNKEGVWEKYDRANVLRSTEQYTEGQLNGWSYSYSTTGMKIDSTLYQKGKIISLRTESNPEKPFVKVIEVIPEYKKGQRAFYTYINSKMKYPKDAKKHGVKGVAIVEFTIERDGKVSNVKVIRGLCASIRDVCYQIFENMPDWNPGTQNGIPVRVHYSLPITFNLE